ncbi:pTP [Fowl aviadenovirus A]|nr:pTP [Fowl aviadenovirus A]
MAAYRVFADLTGQSLATVRFCEPVITADYVLVREEPALVHPRSVFLVSRVYDYRLMQLRDLAPRSPNVAAPPYNGLPPPHLLLGYQAMHRALNDYLFDNRVFMQIGYDSPPQRPRRLFWTCLTDCSYAVNVGQYMRFLDLDNFHGTFTQMHNAVLMDRVAADMGRAHLRGRGIDVGRHGQVLPQLDAEHHSLLSGNGAGGLQEGVLMRTASAADAELLAAIRQLRVALCHYLFCYAYDLFQTEERYRFLPGSDVFLEPNWLSYFAEAFAELDTQQLVRDAERKFRGRRDVEEPTETMARCFMSTLASDAVSLAGTGLSGGAITLCSRRVTDRTGLRPRDRHGRAITASEARRIRPRAVRAFVDRLPRVTRRRRRPPSPAPPPEEIEEAAMEVEEPEEEEEELLDEVIRTALEAIGALQDELSGAARRHELFRFANDFYRMLLTARDAGLMGESFLRKWVLYFFLAEHIASTLYYLYSHFIANREFRRYVDVLTLQVLVVGWDVNAQQVFKRIWSEQSNPATIFETLWERILRDFLMMVERTGQFEGMDDADQQLFLSDIQYRDRSGDIEEVLKQLNLSEELIDSIDISFRIKFKGIVAIATNEEIKANLRRVLRHRREDIEAAARRGQPL